MFSTIDKGNKNAQQASWEQRLLKLPGRPKTTLKPEYQELKFTLHRKLLDKINLEALATIDNQRVRSEVRQALFVDRRRADTAELDSKSSRSATKCWTRYSDSDRSSRCCRTRPSPTSWSTRPSRSTSSARPARTDQCRVPRRPASAAHHRQDRSARSAAASTNRRPMVDARLSDGSRVNAIIPPLAVDGPLLSIRRFRHRQADAATIWWSARR